MLLRSLHASAGHYAHQCSLSIMGSFAVHGIQEQYPVMAGMHAQVREPFLDQARAEWIAEQLLTQGDHGVLLPVNTVLDAYVRGKARWECSMLTCPILGVMRCHGMLTLIPASTFATAAKRQMYADSWLPDVSIKHFTDTCMDVSCD